MTQYVQTVSEEVELKVLMAVVELLKLHDQIPPTVREIQAYAEIPSTSTVQLALKQLEQHNLIFRPFADKTTSRNVRVTQEGYYAAEKSVQA
jgi:SOS-response transcriptional repressor LexA